MGLRLASATGRILNPSIPLVKVAAHHCTIGSHSDTEDQLRDAVGDERPRMFVIRR